MSIVDAEPKPNPRGGVEPLGASAPVWLRAGDSSPDRIEFRGNIGMGK